MKKNLLGIIISFFLISCGKEPEENNNSGLLMSVTSYGGDSAKFDFQYQNFTFKYDDLKRVKEILKNSDNLTTSSEGTIIFKYDGASVTPNLIVDSTPPTNFNTNHVVYKTHLYFNNLGDKIKDSTYHYWRSSTNPGSISPQPLNQHWVNAYSYTPAYITRSVIHGLGIGQYIDSLFIGPDNEVERTYGGLFSLQKINLIYYDDENPLSELNICKSLIDVKGFFGLTLHPLIYDNLNRPKHLPKRIFGQHFEPSNNQDIEIKLYFTKNLAGKIDKIVIAKRRWYRPSGTLFDFYYMTYKFQYYP